MVKKYESHFVIIFKNVTESHEAIISNFSEHAHVFVNHKSKVTFDLPIVWAQSTRYLNSQDSDTLSAMAAIKENSKLDLVSEQTDYNEHLYSNVELQGLSIDDAVWEQTNQLETLCQAEMIYHQSLLPKYKTPNQQQSDAFLWQLLADNLQQLNLPLNKKELYQTRLEHEYQIITKMGFEDYFLIVSDLIQYAKNNDVLVGPGRGSAAGSLVSYLLNITTIDPIEYNLLFERF